MTIELKELVIRTSIGDNSQSSSEQPPELNQDELVSECVKQVLKKLQQTEQR